MSSEVTEQASEPLRVEFLLARRVGADGDHKGGRRDDVGGEERRA